MTRLRHRPDQFFHRGDRFAFHRLQDGATLGRLDPYSPEPQRWLLHSGRTIDVTAEEVRDITKQVHDLDLPDMRPGGGSCNCGERLSVIEARLAVLEAAPLAPPPPAPVLGDKLGGLEELLAKIDRVRATGEEPEDFAGIFPTWFIAEERDGESVADRIARLTKKFRARVNELTNKLLGGDITPEEEAERDSLMDQYNMLAEMGDRS